MAGNEAKAYMEEDTMAFTDNFGHPKGLLGRLMLISLGDLYPFPQQILCCHYLIRHLFISCQLSDKR